MNRRITELLRFGALGFLVIPAVLRVCTLISPNPFFAFDPMEISLPHEGIGPAGSLMLDACSWFGFLLVLIVDLLERGHVDWRLAILALLPAAALGFHTFSWPTPYIGFDGAISDQMAAGQAEMRESLLIGMLTIKHPGNLVLGSNWLAAILTGIGASMLGRDHRMRVLMIGAVVALVAPLAVKAIYQVTVEHQDTLAGFEQSKESVYRAHGWAPDSVQARLYERRLEQAEATGWFGLSNVFGTVALALSVFWMGITLAAARTKLSSGWVGLLGCATVAAMVSLALTFSKGAIASSVIGIVLVLGVILPRHIRRRLMPRTGAITGVLILLTLGAVGLRGLLFGERFTADGFSLLFRWQYWIGAYRMFVENPIWGVGPEGFKAAYLVVKPVLSPEEVASPHSVFISWISTLGIFSVSWIAVIFILVHRVSPHPRSVTSPELPENAAVDKSNHKSNAHPTGSESEGSARIHWVLSSVIGFLALGSAWWLNHASFYPDFANVLWPLAMAAYIGLMGTFPWVGRHSSWALIRWALWSSVTIMLIHSQIEMSMTRSGATAALFLLLGASAIVDRQSRATHHGGTEEVNGRMSPHWRMWSSLAVTTIVAIGFGFISLGIVRPVRAQQRALQQASLLLGDIGSLRLAMTTEVGAARDLASFNQAVQEVTQSLRDAGADPNVDGRLRELQAAIQDRDTARIREIQQSIWLDLDFSIKKIELYRFGGDPNASGGPRSRGALPYLEEAMRLGPFDSIAWDEQIKIWITLARAHHDAGAVVQRDEALQQAVQLSEQLLVVRPDLASSYSKLANVHIERSVLLNDALLKEPAAVALEQSLRIDPLNLRTVKRLADLRYELRELKIAAELYERLLQIDEQTRLDPLKQLTEDERTMARRRLDASGG